MLGGKQFGITRKQYDMFSEAYPALDVMAQLRLMNTWLMANPKNQKTNVLRFVNNWLVKSQDRASRFSTKSEGTPIVAERPKSVLDEERV